MTTDAPPGLSSIAGFCAALLPPEAGGPDPSALAAKVERFIAQMPSSTRLALRAAFRVLDGAAWAVARKSFAKLDEDGRSQALDRVLGNSAGAEVFQALKALVLLVAGSEGARHELLDAAAATGLARPDAPLDVTPAEWWPSTLNCDAVVVGSGAGGAFTARSLARAGLDVVIVEEGKRWSVDEFRSMSPMQRFAELYRDAATTIAFGRPPVVLPVGRGVGGTTLINSGTCYRPPEDVLIRWRDLAGIEVADPETFAPYLDDVEETLQVAPVPADVMGRNGAITLAGAASLGWESGPLVRNAPGCDGCCQCSIGCPRNAKFGVHLNALPQACDAGARIVSEARVDRVLHENGRATGILARRANGTKFEVRAPRVVVAAGATETPPLLRRSGLGGHPRLGGNLAVHPAVAVAAHFDEEVISWKGVLQSAGVEEFRHSRGILMEATSTPPGMGSLVLPGHGRMLLEEIEHAGHLANLGAMISDRGSGKVMGAKRTVIRYDLTPEDGARLIEALGLMAKLLLAAGARDVILGVPGAAPVTSAGEAEAALAGVSPRQLHVAAFHPTGTAAAGSDGERYPCSPRGALRGTEGVWVADACLLPESPTVNPQVSIMAMALVVAKDVARTA